MNLVSSIRKRRHSSALREKGALDEASDGSAPMRGPKRSLYAVTGATMVGTILFVVIFAPLLTSYDPNAVNAGPQFTPPSAEYWFGTDNFGRDVFARVLYGGRSSFSIAAAAVVIALTVGTILGVLSGYYGAMLDAIVMRFVDVLLTFPPLILAITVVALVGSGSANVALALGVIYVPQFIRVSRSCVLGSKPLPYVVAARAIGDSDTAIILRQIIPSVIPPIVVLSMLTGAYALLTEAGLSFLGLGTQPPDPSLGRMLSESRSTLTVAPWTVLLPGLFVMVAVMGTALLGDALRDRLDPRLRSVVRA